MDSMGRRGEFSGGKKKNSSKGPILFLKSRFTCR